MDLMEDIKDLVIAHGDNIAQDSDHCKKWLREHENCFGCPTELGCNKMIGLGLAVLSGRPNMDKIYNKILNARTAAEIRAMRELEPICE